jgi:hypothetical protein
MDGAPLQALAESSILLPASAREPAFLVGANFRTILRYNNFNQLSTRRRLAGAKAGWRPSNAYTLAVRFAGTDTQPVSGAADGAERTWIRQRYARPALWDRPRGAASVNTVAAWACQQTAIRPWTCCSALRQFSAESCPATRGSSIDARGS